jgi:DNA (cytosine-5)-methyltransferase 1
MPHPRKIRLIDLFCGCGGLTRGFVDTGRFEAVWANDLNEPALLSYRLNFDPRGAHSVCGDLVGILDEAEGLVPRADVVVGGPPCQGFSLLNRKREGDPRRTLWFQFLRVAQLAGARVIVMENVPQLLSSPEFTEIRRVLEGMGFHHIVSRTLTAADYGVPETRHRAFILASREGLVSLPRPTHTDPTREHGQARFPDARPQDLVPQEPWLDVRSAIGDLPPPVGTEIRDEPPPLDLHFGRNPTPMSLERYRAVPPGGNRFDLQRNRPDITPRCWIRKQSGGTDLFGRLWWDRPSVTIRTEFFKPEKGRYLHPDQDRPITHREAARIQSFPDDFLFHGSKVEIARQIGNAVPPLLARAVAEEVIRCLVPRPA